MNGAMRLPRLTVPLPALLAAVLLSVTVLWIESGDPRPPPDAAAVQRVALRFADQPDGTIRVTDASTGATVATVANGSDAFLRSVVRGLVRERKRQGLGEAPPFELLARADGRLTLLDPATGRRVDLESFGATNAAAFARLLPAPVPRSTP